MRNRERGQTIVASLIVIAIICVCLVYFMGGSGNGKGAKPDGRGKTTLGAAKASGEDVQCQSNVRQARQFLEVAKASDDSIQIASVAEIPGAKSVSKCPVGKEDYVIDQSTGTVKCPHLGHEKY